MTQKILIATTNAGKFREFQALFDGFPFVCQMPIELGIHLEVEESGLSYLENAILKAKAYAELVEIPVLADDTGLEVDALGGAPGLHSARYSPVAGASDADRRVKLLGALVGIPKPWKAVFRCVVAVSLPHQAIETFTGSVVGEIIESESGDHGFGYDRIFWIPQAGKTMADLDMEEKNMVSHRAMAVKQAIIFLLDNLKK